MRTWKVVVYWILAFLPLIIVLILLPGMPERVPAHYNFAGEVTRFGLKYELLIMPVLTLAVAGFLYPLSHYSAKKSERGKQNQKTLFACGQIVSVCFCVLSVVMAYYSGNATENIGQTHAYRIMAFVLSIMFVLMGNLLPKCKRGELFWLRVGFRTPWTVRDDEVWNKTNRVGGYYMVAAGVLGAVLSILLPDMWGFLAVIALIVLVSVGGIIYSWKLYRDLHGR